MPPYWHKKGPFGFYSEGLLILGHERNDNNQQFPAMLLTSSFLSPGGYTDPLVGPKVTSGTFVM